MFLSGAQSPFPDSYEGLQNSIATSVEHRTRCILAGCQVGIPSDLSGPPISLPCGPLTSYFLASYFFRTSRWVSGSGRLTVDHNHDSDCTITVSVVFWREASHRFCSNSHDMAHWGSHLRTFLPSHFLSVKLETIKKNICYYIYCWEGVRDVWETKLLSMILRKKGCSL